MEYGYGRKLTYSFEEALTRVEEELQKEGFGILTEIDVQATLKKKLEVDFPKYKILGACNPSYAHQALQQETEVGLLLPCNVIVYEDEEGNTNVSAINAEAAMGGIVPQLEALAAEVTKKLKKVIDSL